MLDLGQTKNHDSMSSRALRQHPFLHEKVEELRLIDIISISGLAQCVPEKTRLMAK